LLAALCSACDGDDVDATFTQLPCDILEESCQEAVYRATASVAQMRAQGRPPVRSLGVAELESELRELSRPDDPQLEQSWSAALQLLGLLPEGQDVQDAVIENAVASISAFYDAETKQVGVVERETGRAPEEDLFVLAHELAHALRDAESDLLAFRAQHVRSTDSSAASSSLTEGEAMVVGITVVARTMQGRSFSVDWDRFGSSIESSALASIEDSPTPLIAAVEQLPYAYGTQRLAPSWERDGRDAVDALYAEPLLTLLDWTRLRAVEHASLRCFPTSAPAGFVGVDSDTLGLAALIALPVALGTDNARDAANLGDAWRDDRVVIFRREPGTSGAVADHAAAWRLRFVDEDRVEDFADSIGCCLPDDMRRVPTDDSRELLYIAGASEVLDGWTDAAQCGAEADVPVAPSQKPRMAAASR
jgi:hypothetical protein